MEQTSLPHKHICSIIPPNLLHDILESNNTSQETRAAVQKTYDHCGKLLSKRKTHRHQGQSGGARQGLTASGGALTSAAADTTPAPDAEDGLFRKIYSSQKTAKLRKKLLYTEGGDINVLEADDSAKEVLEYFGKTFEFFKEVLGRDGIDDANLKMIGSLHYDDAPGPPGMDNAFWDGDEMVFGDGDGEIFGSFTRNIDVIGHELTHGVVQFTANLEYEIQSGALNESMADVFGTMIKQYFHPSGKQLASDADWLIGEGIFLPAITNAKALRSMKAPGTAYNNPKVGKDRQPATMDGYAKLPNTDAGDWGGVHINSGIPNHAFYLASVALGGYSWEKAGKIWYTALCDKSLKGINTGTAFKAFADLTVGYAKSLFDADVEEAVRKAWVDVKVYSANDGSTGGGGTQQAKLGITPEETNLTLREHVVKGDFASVIRLFEAGFEEVAQQDFDWLHELLDIGCNFEEMARLLIDGEASSPWIPIETPFLASTAPSIEFHQPYCVHCGGHEIDTAPRMHSVGVLKTHQAPPISEVRENIGKCCGIAGVLPHNTHSLGWRSGSSSVHFTGERNSVAWISYDRGAALDLQTISLSILGDLDSILCTIGYLQKVGLCCNAFTILRLEDANKAIELCRIPLSLIENLRMSAEHWRGHMLDSNHREGCFNSAREIMRSILGDLGTAEIATFFDVDDPYSTLNACALVAQILFLGILSYGQAHTGLLHPEFLFEPLEEIHLLGTSVVELMFRKHVVVELLNFACMKDMLQDSVLVFRLSSDVFGFPSRRSQNSDRIAKFDLFASPEDLVDTWGPARFVIDPTHRQRLFAIEVGGGIISRDSIGSEKLEKLHWRAGLAPYRAHQLTFNSRDKVLIGATTVNDKCPLDEHKSWQQALGYIENLGTYNDRWELKEKQAGFQGGQYAILQFNATYIKQNGVTLKQQRLMLPFNEIDLAFLNSNCGLQISFCTGVSRRVPLRALLADVMVPFIESRAAKPAFWGPLKTQYDIVQNFRHGDLEKWFDQLPPSLQETTVHIVRSMLEVLKGTGIDKNGKELVIAWVQKESPYSSLRLHCEKTSLWARILADSEDCATFACITSLCLEIKEHKCRNLEVAPWHNVSNLLDTAVCQHFSNRDIQTVANTPAAWKLQHQVSYWIGKSGTNLIAKVWLTNEDAEPRLVVRQKAIPEKYRARLPKVIVERLRRLRERQVGDAIANQVVILTEM